MHLIKCAQSECSKMAAVYEP